MRVYKVNLWKWFFGLALVMIWSSVTFAKFLTPMMGDQVFLFRGLDGTVDDDMVWDSEDPEEIDGAIADGEPAVNAAVDWLADAVMGFDTEEATANDAMLFLKSVQGHLRRIHKKVLKKKK